MSDVNLAYLSNVVNCNNNVEEVKVVISSHDKYSKYKYHIYFKLDGAYDCSDILLSAELDSIVCGGYRVSSVSSGMCTIRTSRKIGIAKYFDEIRFTTPQLPTASYHKPKEIIK
jgi:hypothetical protein